MINLVKEKKLCPDTHQPCVNTYEFMWTQFNTFTGQIPGANQHIERQEVALQKQMHMSVAM